MVCKYVYHMLYIYICLLVLICFDGIKKYKKTIGFCIFCSEFRSFRSFKLDSEDSHGRSPAEPTLG